MTQPFQPVALTTKVAGDESPDQDRVVVFTLDGVEFTMPRKPRMNLGIRFLWEMKYLGEVKAVPNFLEAMLGKEGFQALAMAEAITPEQFKAVLDIAQNLAMGESESPLGG